MKDTATDIPSTEIQTIKLAQKGSWALPGVCTVRHTSCVSPAGATHNKNNTRKYYSLANLSLTFAPVTLLLGLSPLFDTTSTSSAQLTYLLTKTPSMALPVNSPMLQVEIFFPPVNSLHLSEANILHESHGLNAGGEAAAHLQTAERQQQGWVLGKAPEPLAAPQHRSGLTCRSHPHN